MEDTRTIMLQKLNMNDEINAEVTMGIISHLNFADNTRKIKSHYVVSKSGDVVVDTKSTYSGLFSAYLRGYWENVVENYNKKNVLEWLEENDSTTFKLDTLIVDSNSSVMPYSFKFSIKNSILEAVEEAGDGIQSLKVHVVPGHYMFPHLKFERTTTAFYPFPYLDETSTFIVFPENTTVLNESDLNKKLENEIGSIEQNIEKMNATTYKITSTIKFKKHIITKDKYAMLIDLNAMVEKLKEKTVLYKLN